LREKPVIKRRGAKGVGRTKKGGIAKRRGKGILSDVSIRRDEGLIESNGKTSRRKIGVAGRVTKKYRVLEDSSQKKNERIE